MRSKSQHKNFQVLLACLVITGLLLSACQPQTVETVRTVVVTELVEREGETVIETRVVEVTPPPSETEEVAADDTVTLDLWLDTDIPTLDPQLGEDSVSIDHIENLFVQLTNYDLETAEIIPEAATSWEISEDGLTYTFALRSDIPWVKHNPVTGETIQEVDADGNPRFVTAEDFVYGIRRACDPNIGSYYSTVVGPLIAGCNDVLNAEDPGNIDPALVEAIGVSAPDSQTLVINLAFPAAYFISMTPMWTLSAAPQWAVEEYGEEWIEAGNLVTSGRFVMAEWVHGVRWTMVRNPLTPEDMLGSGNVERVVVNVVPDEVTGYALWLNNEVDRSAIPDAELQTHLENFADETSQQSDLGVSYIGFRMTKPPFDDVRVRRAFAAAFDRETYVQEVLQGQGQPMIHFAPPGIFGAPPIDEVGVGFDPEYAQAQLAEAGFPNCEGFPTVTLLGYSGADALSWIEYAQNQWSTNLGCSADLIQLEQLPFSELLASTEGTLPDEQAPHMWTLIWGPDYADENNWVGDVLWCEADTRSKRDCTEIDELIVEARLEQDPDTRAELYRQIEEAFFGPEGEFPIFPIHARINFVGQHSWLTYTLALFGGQQYYNWSIDWDAKLAARE